LRALLPAARWSARAVGARADCSALIPPRDLAQIDRFVIQLGIDALLERDLAQRAPGVSCLLDFDAIDALLGERTRGRGQQAQRLQQIARDQRDAHVELELALHAADGD